MDDPDDRGESRAPQRVTFFLIKLEEGYRDKQHIQEVCDQIKDLVDADGRSLNLSALPTNDYARSHIELKVVRGMAWATSFISLLIGIIGVLNTMMISVSERTPEIGTLRALGFARISILLSFLFESVVLCAIGGVIGCLAVLPFNGYSTGTANLQTFTEITFSFNFGPWVLLKGVWLALIMGIVGGLFPAIRAVRLNTLQALREF